MTIILNTFLLHLDIASQAVLSLDIVIWYSHLEKT